MSFTQKYLLGPPASAPPAPPPAAAAPEAAAVPPQTAASPHPGDGTFFRKPPIADCDGTYLTQ